MGRSLLLALLVLVEPAVACSRPYESIERIAKRARHILHLEVLSVEDVPNERHGKSGRARVRILKQLRGELPLEEFTLLGGPYDTCAIARKFYLSFTPGERLFLLLDGPVPAGTKAIGVSLAGRVFRGSEAELRAMLAYSAKWRRIRRELIAKMDGAYAAGLARTELVSRTWSKGDEGVYATRLQGRVPLQENCDPREVIDVNRRLLRAYVVDALHQPSERADRFVAHVTDESLARPRAPFHYLELRENAPRDLVSVRWLMMLADDEPDPLVRNRGIPDLDPAVFAPWLARNAPPAIWPRVEVGLRLGRVGATLVVRENETLLSRLRQLLTYYASIGDTKRASDVVDRIASLPEAR